MKSKTNFLLTFLLAIYLFPASAQTINGSNVPTDEVVITYYDEKQKKIRSRGKYNYSGFSGIGKQEGKWEFWHENGQLEEVAFYSKGKLNGRVIKYWENGKKMHEGFFKDDYIDSTMKSWYDNGKMREEGSYKKGDKIGLWKYYDLEGSPTYEEKHIDNVAYLISFWDHKGVKTINNGNGKKIEYFSTYESEKVKPIIKEEYTYENGLIHGPFIEYNPAGVVMAKGNYKNGKRDGDWFFYFSNAQLSKLISFKDDMMHGRYEQYLITDTSYFIKINGNYENDKKQGMWEWKFNNGTTDMKGNFENDLQEGHWYFGYNDGKINFEGSFEKGLREGEWSYFYPDSLLWRRGTFKNDLKNGEWVTWYENGNELSKGNYLDDQPEGLWTSWFQEGQMKDEGTFKAGIMDGGWKGWYPNGQQSYNGSYVKGYKSGKWTYWFDSGKLLDEGEWKVVERTEQLNATGTLTPTFTESIKHGKWVSYDELGVKTGEGSYFEGVKDGKWLYYQPGGVLVANEMNYKKGELHGKVINYLKNGKVESEMEYKENQKDGDSKLYDSRGRVYSHKVYEKGQIVKVIVDMEKPDNR